MHRTAGPSAAMTDEQLMRRVQADDDRAFGLLYDRYQSMAWHIAQLVCERGDRAEAAVQEAFIAIWHQRAAYRPGRETVQAWTIRHVYQRAADPDHRDRPRDARPASDATRVAGKGETDAVEPAEAQELHGLLGRLPASQREIIALAFYGGLTHNQIADVLSLPRRTVKGRMRLGLHGLRDVMDSAPDDEPPQ